MKLPSLPNDFAVFIIALLFIVALTAFPGDQTAVNKTCVENGGYVTQRAHYSTCSQDKPGYKNGVRQ